MISFTSDVNRDRREAEERGEKERLAAGNEIESERRERRERERKLAVFEFACCLLGACCQPLLWARHTGNLCVSPVIQTMVDMQVE